MGMTLLNIAGKNQPKDAREGSSQAPTLFSAARSDSATEEERISVLSAAGGRPGGRFNDRVASSQSDFPVKKAAWLLLLLIGSLSLVGSWQLGILKSESVRSISGDLFSFWQGDSVSRPSAVAGEVDQKILAAEDKHPETERPAVIEKLDVSSGSETVVSDSPSKDPVALSLATALQNTGTTQVSNQSFADIRTSTVRPPTDSKAAASDRKKQAAEKTLTPAERPARQVLAADDKKVTKALSASSKEPDADVQLLEALLVHLRKSDEPKHK